MRSPPVHLARIMRARSFNLVSFVSAAAPRLLLAPMEGMLDARLREVITRLGHYDWCVSEFVRVTDAVLPNRCFRRAAPELEQAARTPAGTPVRVQLLGSDPDSLARNASRLVALAPAGIDLNFGCPAPTVNRHRGGAVLLDEPELLFRIASAVKSAVDGRLPFTAKMRLGVHDTSRAIEAAQALAAGGAELLVVHARTRDDAYRPPAHWAWVGRIAAAVPVPVVANGEIWTLADYLNCRAESGAAAVMLGRGALADPFLAARIRAHLAGGDAADGSADWARVLPEVLAYWQVVRAEASPRHAPGRLKQWLNLLRRRFPAAQTLFDRIKVLREPAAIAAVLLGAGGAETADVRALPQSSPA